MANGITPETFGLSQRQFLFCQKYVQHGNGNRAAIEAGYESRSATVQAAKLLTKGNVKNCLTALNSIISERVQKKVIKDKHWIFEKLSKIAEFCSEEVAKIDKTGDLVIELRDPRSAIAALNSMSDFTGGFNKNNSGKLEIEDKTEKARLQTRKRLSKKDIHSIIAIHAKARARLAS